MISVLILTLNEEANIERCLRSVAWSDDVVVFDSFSTDQTVEIARRAGARVVQRAFDNERDHRAASLRVGFKHGWVYNPDADEVTTVALADEMQRAVANAPADLVAFRVRFKNMLWGRWIRRSSLYPTWVMRLFRPERVTFERTINLAYRADGCEGLLQEHFEHHSFEKGLNAWFEKHNRYSWFEAIETIRSLEGSRFEWRALASRSPTVRRRALKELSFRMPGRPLLRFVYMYIIRGGWLDGPRGFTYCVLLSIYEYMIVLKVEELRRARALRDDRSPSSPS